MARSKKEKIVKTSFSPASKEVRRNVEPDSIMQRKPSWGFARCDQAGAWAISEEKVGCSFWSFILPKLQFLETMTWDEILIRGKKSNHHIQLRTLNKCAQQRIDELQIAEDEILSLRLDGKTRLYGFLSEATFVILWHDDDHGDNDTCVCRSNKKHT